MKPAVQINCPNCRNLLRVPPDMVDISVKCKHCGYILQIKKKAGKGVAPVPVSSSGNERWQQKGGVEPLPEYTPPMANNTRSTASAPTVMPAPIVESLPDADASDYTPAFEGAGQRHVGRGNYKGPRGDSSKVKWIVVSAVVVLGLGVLGAVVVKPEWFRGKPEPTVAEDKKIERPNAYLPNTTPTTVPSGGEPKGLRPMPDNQTAPMPRRMLAIGIFDYLYANQLMWGQNSSSKQSDRHDFFKAVDKLADGWRIPKPQRYFVSDTPGDQGRVDQAHPPLKMVIDGTIDRFLKSCRPQDRIVIVFAGHAFEEEGQVYLTPLEGEFEDLKTLMPLKDFYDKLSKCVAQEKLVVFDVCRFDRSRGVERPAFGVMTEAMDKAFHNCPDGVTVWTACSAGQYSYEEDKWETGAVPGVKNQGYGSVFLGLFFHADSRENLFSKRQNGGGIHHPSDPLPIAPVTKWISEKTEAVSKDVYGEPQTPKVTSKSRKEWLAYDPKEPLPSPFELAKPPATVKREEVAAMFRELSLPDIRAIRKATDNVRLADNFPFTETQLKDFFNDTGPGYDEIAKAPEKFAKEYPLRATAVEALEEMRKLKQDDPNATLPENFTSPINDALKARITNVFQRTVAERQGTLESLKDKFASAAKKREMEKSKRWLATFDYAYAQVRAHFAYIAEYNLALGNVKTDKLPELDMTKKQDRWKLASIKKMTSGSDVRDEAEGAKEMFAEIAKTCPNTPWAVMSKAQKNMSFGLKWEAAGGEADSK